MFSFWLYRGLCTSGDAISSATSPARLLGCQGSAGGKLHPAHHSSSYMHLSLALLLSFLKCYVKLHIFVTDMLCESASLDCIQTIVVCSPTSLVVVFCFVSNAYDPWF